MRAQIAREAEPLLLRPFELARFEGTDRLALTELGIRLVYQLTQASDGTPDGSRAEAIEIERQLNALGLGVAVHLGKSERFRGMILALLEQLSLLPALDNLESLLTSGDKWRALLWGDVIATLLGHEGGSRVILTSRRLCLPTSPRTHPRLQREAIHALSFAESVLLARELPHLGTLFAAEADKELLVRTLRLVQGPPQAVGAG